MSAGKIADRRAVLAILVVIYMFNYADRYLIAALADPLKRDLRLDDAFVGLLLGPAFALLYTLLSVPLARLADRRSRVAILSAGCIVWSLFTALSGIAQNGWTLAAMRIGVGIGEAAFIAPAYSILSDIFPPERRAGAFAVLGLGMFLGQTGGYVAGPAIAAQADWRAAFVALGIAGGAVGLFAATALAEPARGGSGAAGSEPPARLTTVLAGLWRDPAYRLMNIGIALGTFSGYAFGMWAPSLFVRRYDIGLAAASGHFGLAFGCSAMIGMLGFGALANRLGRRDPRWPLRLAAIGLAAATVAIAAACFAPSIGSVTLFAIPAGLLGGGWSIGVMSGLQLVLADRIRATGTALFTLVNVFVGMVIGPYVVGLASSALGSGAAGLQAALIGVIALGLPGALLLWRAAPLIGARNGRESG